VTFQLSNSRGGKIIVMGVKKHRDEAVQSIARLHLKFVVHVFWIDVPHGALPSDKGPAALGDVVSLARNIFQAEIELASCVPSMSVAELGLGIKIPTIPKKVVKISSPVGRVVGLGNFKGF
jgi:hypothetical protein